MQRNDELKDIHLKNCTCYYFDEIMRGGDFDFDDNLLNKKSNESWYKHVLVFDISCKTFVGGKPLCIRFDKIYGFINVSDGIKYFALFGPWRYDTIYGRTRYLINEKSGITYTISHNFGRIRIDSLPTQKTLTFHVHVIIFIKPVEE